jgi:aarF domain-containing kinase
LLRRNKKTGKPQIVLVDHGLYRDLDNKFRLSYAKLWKSLMLADLAGIKTACEDLGLNGEAYTLFSAMLTARPFDEIVERAENKSLGSSVKVDSAVDKVVIRGYAQRFLTNIFDMLATLPRQMLLLLKVSMCDVTREVHVKTVVINLKFSSLTRCYVYFHYKNR